MTRFILATQSMRHYHGYGIELKLNDHRNECAVYLEPVVLQALTEFYKRCSQPENN